MYIIFKTLILST